MKQFVIWAVLWLVACLFIPGAKANDLNFYRYFYGVNYQNLTVHDVNAGSDLAMQVDDRANALGLYFKGEPWSFVQFAMGFDFVKIGDDNPFTQQVKNDVTGSISNRQSDVTGKSIYGEIGLKYDTLPNQNLTFGALGGFRYNSISRSIFRCSSCQEQQLDSFESSLYIKPFIELQMTKNTHVQVYYNYYFNDTGFSDGVGIQISFFAQ